MSGAYKNHSSQAQVCARNTTKPDVSLALRTTYCPPLDEALFYAITSEYELPQDREAITAILESLKAGALEQDAADFDPSGTGGPSQQKDYTDTSRSGPEDAASTGVTSITTGISELLGNGSDTFGHDLNDASIEAKTAWLNNVFPDIPKQELLAILESHGGFLDKATDELLNLSFLKQGNGDHLDEIPVLKGIDGFAEGINGSRKSRKRRRQRTTDSSRASSASSYLPEEETNSQNVWSTMSEDVQFICSRTHLQPQPVRSIYHSNRAHLGRTIRSLAMKESATYKPDIDEEALVELQIAEFNTDFETVPKELLYGLLSLARNIPSAARELLEAMMSVDRQRERSDLTLSPQYVPIKLEDDGPQRSKSPSASTWSAIKPNARGSAAIHQAAASHNFSQASAAYKKGKSDRLMGGAAAYYAQVGHERMRAAKEIYAAEADTHVARQSSATTLDLHGVSVADAVRIANDRTQGWWDSLGDAKYASGGGGPMRAGFKIVTGVGTHSKNHAPRIGPAVSKMLIREGWKVEIGHGELIVTGRLRRH
ncbi:hypothetical protein LTR84_012052 [Exophiala bonariae]|uniref:Smr domain-containing protein n=1 Tax=Exophiala bonariae TaxID=1690606 RepID=A0AAV9NFG1_9EURO|nr:hypothetical protein LTR84_012052 [Exophiala bonariae]